MQMNDQWIFLNKVLTFYPFNKNQRTPAIVRVEETRSLNYLWLPVLTEVERRRNILTSDCANQDFMGKMITRTNLEA
jgi:hypothetical protein